MAHFLKITLTVSLLFGKLVICRSLCLKLQNLIRILINFSEIGGNRHILCY